MHKLHGQLRSLDAVPNLRAYFEELWTPGGECPVEEFYHQHAVTDNFEEVTGSLPCPLEPYFHCPACRTNLGYIISVVLGIVFAKGELNFVGSIDSDNPYVLLSSVEVDGAK